MDASTSGAALPGKVPREGAWGRRAVLPVCLWGFISMSSLSEIMRRAERRLGSLLSLPCLRVALPLVTLFVPRTEHLLQQGQTLAGFPLALLRKLRRWSKCLSRLGCCGVRQSQPVQQRSPCLCFFSFIAQRYLKVSGAAAGAVFALPRSTCLPAARFPPISLPLLAGGRGLGGDVEALGVRGTPVGLQASPSAASPRTVRSQGRCPVWDGGRDTRELLSHQLCFSVPISLAAEAGLGIILNRRPGHHPILGLSCQDRCWMHGRAAVPCPVQAASAPPARRSAKTSSKAEMLLKIDQS